MPPKEVWPARYSSYKVDRLHPGAKPSILLHSVTTWEAGPEIGRSITTRLTREHLIAMLAALDEEGTI